MGLETGTYISDLVTTNPTPTDFKKQGDDHIRLLKSTLQTTFPNISGAVTPTHTELNYVDGVTSAIQDQLDTLTTSVSGKLSKTVSTTQRVLARDTAGAGDAEEVALTDVLDWLSTTQGVLLYRGASSWDALAPGTSGQYLKTQGSGANPTWSTAGLQAFLSDPATTSGTEVVISSIPATATKIDIVLRGVSWDDASALRLQLGTGGGPTYVSSGYAGQVVIPANTYTAWSTFAQVTKSGLSASTLHNGRIVLTKNSADVWQISSNITVPDSSGGFLANGYVDAAATLTAIKFSLTSSGSFNAGGMSVYTYS